MTATTALVAQPARDDEQRRVELWVRTEPTWTAHEHVGLVERLERLESDGWLDEFEIRSWGPDIDPTRLARTERDAVVQDRLRAFRAWAWRTGRRLSGLETTATCGQGRMGEERTVVRLPPVALAAYRDGVLEWVAPTEDASGPHTVSEWVAAAERQAFGVVDDEA